MGQPRKKKKAKKKVKKDSTLQTQVYMKPDLVERIEEIRQKEETAVQALLGSHHRLSWSRCSANLLHKAASLWEAGLLEPALAKLETAAA